MESTMAAGAVGSTQARAGVGSAMLPLNMVREGETVHVLKVRGDQETRQHLANLGFVENAEVKVISRTGGDVVVSVKGATLGLSRDMAKKITTC